MPENVETIIVGAGQAGLSVSCRLSEASRASKGFAFGLIRLGCAFRANATTDSD